MPPDLSVVYYTDSPLVGGAEIALGTLLTALDPAIDVAIAGTHTETVSRLAERRPSARVVLLPVVGGKGDLAGWAGNLRGIARLHPAVFQLNSGGAAAGQHALVAATLLPGVRTVVVEHAATDVDTPLQRRMKAFTNRRLAAHVAPGRAAAGEIEAINGLPPGSVRALPNGVEDIELTPIPRVSEGFVIGTSGRLQQLKGFDLLIRALAELPGAQLVIVGDGPERAALGALAAELELGDRVHFVGWRDDARSWLTAFDVFALPSRLESFGLAIVEAMLARLPVVATRIGGIPEIVTEGETALLVERDDLAGLVTALRLLAADPERRHRMGAAGRERALELSPAAMARAYERLYAEILSP